MNKVKTFVGLAVVTGIWVHGFLKGIDYKTYEVSRARKNYDKATSRKSS